MDCQPCGSLTSSGDMDGRRRGYFCITDKLYVRRKRKKLYVSLLMVHKLSYQEKKYTRYPYPTVSQYFVAASHLSSSQAAVNQEAEVLLSS